MRGTDADGTRIPVQRKRRVRAQFASQMLQHLPAVLTVVAAGASAIQSERDGGGLALAVAELVVGAFVLVTIAFEARHLFGRETGHDAAAEHDPRVDVAGLAAAALGYVEVWHHAHERGHLKLFSPYTLGATVTLFLALGGRRMIQRRFRHRHPHLMVTSAAMTYRGSRGSRWTAAWADVAGVAHGHDELALRLHDGRTHVLRADDHFGGHGLIAAARTAIVRHAPAHLTNPSASDASRPGADPGTATPGHGAPVAPPTSVSRS